MAHFNIDSIKNKLLKIHIPTTCPICVNSKLKNKPFKNSTNRAKHNFELIHMDLIGPITESLYNNKYILSILDDHSRYGWVLFITNKSDTFETFYNWFSKIKNIYNTRIKFIRSDNGTEFKNIKFNDFCKIYGIFLTIHSRMVELKD